MSEALSDEIYRTALEGLPTGVCMVDQNRKIVLWNDRAEQITGYHRHEVIGRLCFDNLLMHCDENNVVLCSHACPLARTMHDGNPRELDVFLLHKDGERVPVRVRVAPIRDEHGLIIGAAETFDECVRGSTADVSPNGSAVRNFLDEATGIPNRNSVYSHLAATLQDFHENQIPFGVLSISIDGLDRLQQFRGRKAVQAIVRVAAHTLAKNLRPADAIGVWSENRFVAVATECPAPALEKVSERLRRIVGLASVSWWGDRIPVTISIGGATVRPDDTVEALLGRSEEALQAVLTKDVGCVVAP